MNIKNITEISELYDKINEHNFNSVLYHSVVEQRIIKKRGSFEGALLKLSAYSRAWYAHKIHRRFMCGYSNYDFAKDVVRHSNEYKHLYEILADKDSKAALLAVLKFKLTLDNEMLNNVSKYTLDQYFDPSLVSLGPNEVIADCGGYIGDTANAFFRLYKTAKSYYLIEPGEAHMRFARRNLAEFNGINFCQCASGAETSKVFISGGDRLDAGASCSQTQTSSKTSAVEQITLDELIKERVTFVKMDIEGAELDTLKGCKNHIVNDKPKLAVCTYHKPGDAWVLANYILGLRSDYRLYLRIYESPYCEAVLYAL